MGTTVGEFNEYTDGPTSFDPEPLPTAIDASEFRDLSGFAEADLTKIPRTGPDTSAVSAGDDAITRDRGRRHIQSDGSSWHDVEPVQNVGARTYSTSVVWVHPSGDYAAPVPVLLLAVDDARMRVLVSHAGAPDTAGVVIGSLTDIQSGHGFFIPQGATTEIKVQGAVYVTFPNWAVNPAQPTPLTLWIERGL